MKNVSHKKNWKKIILLVLIILFAGFGLLFALKKPQPTDIAKSPSNYPPSAPTAKQQEQERGSSAENKGKFLDSQYSNTDNENTTPNPPSNKIDLTSKQEGSTVVITAKMSGITNGTCTLTITNAGRATTKSAEVIYQPEFSSCAGFAVPVSDVGTGLWTIALSVSAAGGQTASQTSTLEVK